MISLYVGSANGNIQSERDDLTGTRCFSAIYSPRRHFTPAETSYDETTRTGYIYDVLEISDAILRTPDGDEFMPADLIDRIEIEGYRRVWSGAYVWIDDMDGWLTAAEAQRLYGVAPATVRQAINREIADEGKVEWARKSAGTWMVRRAEAQKRWEKK